MTMKVTLTDAEVREVRVAIRMTEAAHTALVSMSPSKDIQRMLMDALRTLHDVDRQLGGS